MGQSLRPTASIPPSLKDFTMAVTLAASLATATFTEPSGLAQTAVSSLAVDHSSITSSDISGVESLLNAKELIPGSVEYNIKNARRYELIEKKVDGTMNAAEATEFAVLQQEILSITKKHFPRPSIRIKSRSESGKERAETKSDIPE